MNPHPTMKTTLLLFSIIFFSNIYSQQPFISIERNGFESVGKLIEFESTIMVLGRYDSIDNEYLFINEYDLSAQLIESNSIQVPFEDETFAMSDFLWDSIQNYYYFVGRLYIDINIEIQIGIIKVDENCEILDFFKLGDEDVSEFTYTALINASGNLIIAGYALNINKAFIYEYTKEGEFVNEIIYDDDTYFGVLDLMEDVENNRYISSQKQYVLTTIDKETLTITGEDDAQIRDSSYLMRYLHDLNFSSDFLTSYIEYSNFEVDYTNFYIARLNQDFDTLWSLDFGSPISDILFFPESFAIADTNSFWLTYSTCDNCFNFLYEQVQHTIGIINFNGAGEIINEYYINGEFNYGYQSLTASGDGGVYIISSHYNWTEPANDLDIIIFKMDQFGNLLTSTDDLEYELNKINVFPNPTTDFLYFQNAIANKQRQIVIYAYDGKEVLTQMISTTETQVDVKKLSPGIYVYGVFEEGEKIQDGKFVKQ